MKSEFEWNRMIQGKMYSPYKVGDDSWEKVHSAQKRFNESEFWHDTSALEKLKKCFGKAPEDMVLTPPVYFDHGDRVLAPHVSIYTAGNPCRVIREITEEDRNYWQKQYDDYAAEKEKTDNEN